MRGKYYLTRSEIADKVQERVQEEST